MLKGTLTGLPLCFPGIIIGKKDIILLASPSRFLSDPHILILEILPSSEIIKFTKNTPLDTHFLGNLGISKVSSNVLFHLLLKKISQLVFINIFTTWKKRYIFNNCKWHINYFFLLDRNIFYFNNFITIRFC